MFNGISGVYYREIKVLKTRLMRTIAASFVSPALFFIAFGYGLGRSQVYGGVQYLEFLFAGLLAMSTLNACYGISTDINISRFYHRIFDEYLISPNPRWQIAAGETLYGITKGMISAAVFFVYAAAADLNITIGPMFAAALLLHMAVFSLLGFIVAMSVKNHGDQAAINTFLITPMTFLSGVFFPVEKMPAAFSAAVQIFPATHSVSLIRSSLTGGTANPGNIFILVLFFVIFSLIAVIMAGKAECR